MQVQSSILTISGSDSAGLSGIQADIKTIAALGGLPLSAITCITTHDTNNRTGKKNMRIFDLPTKVVASQTSAIVADVHPECVKVGLIRGAETVKAVRNEIVGCRHTVIAPGIYATDGTMLVDDDTIQAIGRYLVPDCDLLMLRCRDAERMLGMSISSDEDMQHAARLLCEMGAHWVMLRGGQHFQGRLVGLLFGSDDANPQQYHSQFFTSHNTEGWLQRGVGGALSAAIATRLGLDGDVPTAIRRAHEYIHSQVVYAQKFDGPRSLDIYQSFTNLIAEHYRTEHDVEQYANMLNITRRYLSNVTHRVAGSSPKEMIDNYIMQRAKVLLSTTRMTVQEIAYELGFKNDEHFSKFFMRLESVRPGQFRKL